MKKGIILVAILVSIMALVGCTEDKDNVNSSVTATEVSHEDGTYRGTFSDRDSMQVGIEFKLADNVVKEIKFRHLAYGGTDYRNEETDKTIIGLKEQYEELLDYLLEKDIRKNLVKLYEPGKIVEKEIDAFTGATIRAGKVISAIRDGLNRGVYSY